MPAETPFYCLPAANHRSILLIAKHNISPGRLNARGVKIQERFSWAIREFKWDPCITVDEVIHGRTIKRRLEQCAEILIEEPNNNQSVARLLGRYLAGQFNNPDVIHEIEDARLTDHFRALMHRRRRQ